jgi:2,3-bisphosphoglycerate-dependent phosphoglycerate mutase
MDSIDTAGADASIAESAAQLLLVRHCQSVGQEPDAPLTSLGREQATRLARALHGHGIARIVSSPYLRARQSIEPLAAALGLPVETDHRLIERILAPTPLDDWRERLRAAWDDMDLALLGGESSNQAIRRGMTALDAVLAAGRLPAVVVTHGNLLALLLHAFDGRPGFTTWERLTNPDLFAVVREPAGGPETRRWRATRTWRP